MIWNVAGQIANLSGHYEPSPGDIINSETPENAGPMIPGDLMVCGIDNVGELQMKAI